MGQELLAAMASTGGAAGGGWINLTVSVSRKQKYVVTWLTGKQVSFPPESQSSGVTAELLA